MSWGRSPSSGLGALGRSPFKGPSSNNPLYDDGRGGGSTSSEGRRGGGGENGSDWMLLDERVSSSSAPQSRGGSGSREFLLSEQQRRRSMSLDIPQHQQQQQYQQQQQHQQAQHSHSAGLPIPHAQQHQRHHSHHHGHQHPHRPSSSFNSNNNSPGALARDFSGLSYRDRSASTSLDGGGSSSSGSGGGGMMMMMMAGGEGGSSAGSSKGGLGITRSSAFSSSTSSSGASGDAGSESAIQRQYRSRLEEADQQTAYWQARAKEAEQAILKYKTECVTLRCQLNAQQCTMNSLDEVLVAIMKRLESIMAQVGIPLAASSSSFDAGAGVGEMVREDERTKNHQTRPLALESIELGLIELEKRVSRGEAFNSIPKDTVINFRKFVPGDLALFFPTPAGDYLAFNVGCPHHYLSDESKAMIGQDKHFRKYYVLGRITKLVRYQVPIEESSSGSTSSSSSRISSSSSSSKAAVGPYNLAAGCRYAVVFVEPIESLSSSSDKSKKHQPQHSPTKVSSS